MFASKQRGTVIAKGLKIVGSVTAEGLVEVNGQIEGELHCTSLVIAREWCLLRRSFGASSRKRTSG
jgi:cytoskeletal protein CcmA (bactofilin family)